ncbi:MAG: glycoside hydrolase family 127 protein [Prolixibacteraceae bacterium]|nr:glycoside hydrolase family 127 protein [Prolixibacteraceae bacterium]
MLSGFQKVKALLIIVILSAAGCRHNETQPATQQGKIRPVSFVDVHFADNFWLPRMEINRTVSIPSAFHQCEINGRFDNFALAGGLKECEHQGDFSFDDTDPYKIIEGASYSLAVKYDARLDAYLDSVIALIAAAQEPDGYLTTCVTNKCYRLSGWWGRSRWERINSHELYNSGHLYEAAVAHYRATGKRLLLDVALRNADLVCETFGLGENQIKYPSGHPIIEMALVKLHEVTGDEKYLTQARYFVDEAGRLSNGRKPGIYSQDHKPVTEQDEIVGHAVRAGYFYSGVTDVAALQSDKALFAAVERVWDNMVGHKLYLNGGIGSRPQGEGFGPDYELNNFNNYCETCASIANVYWNHRMFLATGEAKYVDVLERTLYNGLIAGVSLSGDKFFYDNPMASHGGHHREPWFGCACCPGNVTRFMASVPLYNYAVCENNIYVNLYVEGNAKIKLPDSEVELLQTTEYPWSGNVGIEVNPASGSAGRFSVSLRIPGWADGRPVPSNLYRYVNGRHSKTKIFVNGKKQKPLIHNGYAILDRQWERGDVITLEMDMPVRRVQAHPSVEYNEGLLAMERGPILYALESVDQNRDYIFDMVIPRDAKITGRFEKDLLGDVVLLEGDAYAVEQNQQAAGKRQNPVRFTAIPYSAWNNRGHAQMAVWIPESAEKAIPKPEPTIASRARQIGGYGFNDQFEPRSSRDINTPYHYWWLKNGTEEHIGYQFDEPTQVSSVEVFWLAFEHYDVIYKAPKSWKLFYKDGGNWKEVENASGYGVEIDRYNKVVFKPVTTTELRLTAQLRRSGDEDGEVPEAAKRGYSGGVIEWKVY